MMTPEEIQQVVEDYRKSNSLNEEIFSKKVQNFFRNFGRNPEDKVNVDKKNENKIIMVHKETVLNLLP